MPWTTNNKAVELREKSAVVDVVVGTLDGWRRHLSGRNASVLSLFGFLTIFPLLLVATTILGFVLEDNEELQQKFIDGALENVPVLGAQLADDPAALTGSVGALVVGLLTALWSSTKAFVGLQLALDDVWEIHVDNRAGLAVQRSRALIGILIIGAAQFASVGIVTLAERAGVEAASRLLLLGLSVVVNTFIIAAIFRFLTSVNPTWRDVIQGALAAGVISTLLQHFGTAIVRKITTDATETYGSFALVLGLITWIGLFAITVLMAAEMNAALVWRRDGSLNEIQNS
jgi:membrane protein